MTMWAPVASLFYWAKSLGLWNTGALFEQEGNRALFLQPNII